MIQLSILIPTLHNRKFHFNNISKMLKDQIKKLEDPREVEILTFTDNRGDNTTGHKRNVLLNKSNGKFVVFVDDDDKLADTYVALILQAIKNNPDIDAIGIRGMYSENGKQPQPFETSLKHNWEFRNGWYYRTINHISPIKRKHAITVKFPDITIGEDYAYTMELMASGLLKKEVVIEYPIYFYNFISNKRY